MSEVGSHHRRVSLDTLAAVDPEALPIATSRKFAFKYIDISAVSEGKLTIPSSTVEYGDAPSRARRILRSGDVIMSTVRPNLKAFAYCRLDSSPYVASTGFAVLRAKENVVPYFLLCSLLSDDVSGQINRLAVGSNYPAITSSDVRRLQLLDFSDSEQKRIAAILTSIDTTIEKTEALIAKYQQIKAGLMHDLFTRGVLPNGQLRPPREQAPELYQETVMGWIPVEWSFTTCEAVCERIIDCKNRTPAETPDGHPAIRTSNVRNGEFVDKELLFTDARSYLIWTARGKPQVGDVVITREAPVGEVCMIPERHPEACLGQRMMLYRPNKEIIDPRYFLFALQSRQIQNRLDLISGGSTVGHVRVGDIRSLWMFMPESKDEQKQIAGALFQATELLVTEQIQRNKLQRQKLGLMQDLLTGKVAAQVNSESLEAAGG